MGTEAPATPPSVAPDFTPPLGSTPHSCGTAAHARTLIDERYRTPYHGEGSTADNNLAANLSNKLNVQYDLKYRERWTFVTMLKALMLRQITMEDRLQRNGG